jgi:hypothetical protein
MFKKYRATQFSHSPKLLIRKAEDETRARKYVVGAADGVMS